MKSKVQKWGNSLAVRIPKPFADETGLGPSASIQMMVDEGAIVIRRDSEIRWTLASLLAGVTDDNIHGEWETGAPEGREAW